MSSIATPTEPQRKATENDGASKRLSALAAAVRQHEGAQRKRHSFARHSDLHLYRRLRQICGDFRADVP